MIAALQSCLHDLSALGPGGVLALVSALFLAGLAGGATHCAAMCAPSCWRSCAPMMPAAPCCKG
jgi:hypothetical protein